VSDVVPDQEREPNRAREPEHSRHEYVRGGCEPARELFIETAKLSESFFEQLQRHPVPVEEVAIRQISNNSQALDIYCWLAYRLHVVPPDSYLVEGFHIQFGRSVPRIDHFRGLFKRNLDLALAVYPEAKVGINASGLILTPSKPPVTPKQSLSGTRLLREMDAAGRVNPTRSQPRRTHPLLGIKEKPVVGQGPHKMPAPEWSRQRDCLEIGVSGRNRYLRA
jgi:hypothetical protein